MQLARHPSDAWASILAVWNPSKMSVEYFESVALPFGSVSAVMCFSRMARALCMIMAELFLVVNTNFFDDFCQIEVDDLCDSAWSTAEMVMKLLGWRISVSDDKRLPFSIIPSRCWVQCWTFLRLQRARSSWKTSNHARMTSLRWSIRLLPRRQLLCPSWRHWRGGFCMHQGIPLESAHNWLSESIWYPKQFVAVKWWRWILICAKSFFLHWRPWSKLVSGGKSQLIGQAEIFPTLVSKRTWRCNLELRPVLWFVDNSSAQAALVRSFSPAWENYELLTINSVLGVALQSLNWYSRVPSKSNPGDAPSRLEFSQLDAQGYVRCKPCYSLHEVWKWKGWEGVKGWALVAQSKDVSLNPHSLEEKVVSDSPKFSWCLVCAFSWRLAWFHFISRINLFKDIWYIVDKFLK